MTLYQQCKIKQDQSLAVGDVASAKMWKQYAETVEIIQACLNEYAKPTSDQSSEV